MLKRLLVLTFVFVLAACGSDDDPNVTIATFSPNGNFNATLVAGQQTPQTASTDTATAFVEYDSNANLIRMTLDVSNVSMLSTATVNIGAIGTSGRTVFTFPDNGTDTLELFTVVSPQQMAALLDGSMYISVSTSDFPNGAIRAQILPSDVVVVSFSLSGAQEVPAVATAASGDGYASYNTASQALSLIVNTTGADDASMAHIHTGRVGNNGPVLVALESGDTGVWQTPAGATLDADTFAVLASGGHYVNVHTPANPSGEIRGQILTSNFALATFKLDGKQEVPAISTSASGDGYALVNTDDYAVELTVVTQGVEDASMAHIHTGRIGENGPVLVALEQSASNVNVWSTPEGAALNAEIFSVLASGGHYVNVHTPANPSGELRGQILTSNFALVTFGLGGAQEVPAVSSMATGDGYALVNTNDFALELNIVTQGVEDATMAHIHTGRVGNNGPVLVGLEQSMDDVNVWSVPEGTSLNAEIFGILASGGHYVNVHTPANPSGEIRGQILTNNLVLVTFALSGEQEVPALTTSASGSGYAIVNTNDYALELSVVTEGVMNATMAHIHTGRVGMNGPVLLGLEQSMTDPNVWVAPEGAALNADIFAVLASGGHYVNVHTPANPSGELRGQIVTGDFVLVTFPLTGDQEVPAVMTEADGDGYALVNVKTFDLELVANTRGVSDAVMAHIHTGDAGTNGPVLVALTQPDGVTDTWMTDAGVQINADILTVLAGGGHYVNVHTPANPSGEIRGQIE